MTAEAMPLTRTAPSMAATTMNNKLFPVFSAATPINRVSAR